MFKGTNWPSEALQSEEASEICSSCQKSHRSTQCVTGLCRACCTTENSELFCPRHQLRRPLKVVRQVKYSTPLQMLPPWLEYPSYERCGLGWRMGSGESYWHQFWTAYCQLSQTEQKWYRQDFPADREWIGVYEEMIDYNQSEDDDPTN